MTWKEYNIIGKLSTLLAGFLFFFFLEICDELYFCLFVCFFILQVLISHQFYTHQCIHVNPNRPIQHTTIPTPPQFSPLGVHISVLYICVSTSAHWQDFWWQIFFSLVSKFSEKYFHYFHILKDYNVENKVGHYFQHTQRTVVVKHRGSGARSSWAGVLMWSQLLQQ